MWFRESKAFCFTGVALLKGVSDDFARVSNVCVFFCFLGMCRSVVMLFFFCFFVIFCLLISNE